jgi:hypothetical protein
MAMGDVWQNEDRQDSRQTERIVCRAAVGQQQQEVHECRDAEQQPEFHD